MSREGWKGNLPDCVDCILDDWTVSSGEGEVEEREREREREARVDVGIEAGHVVGFLCGTDKISIYTESSIYR